MNDIPLDDKGLGCESVSGFDETYKALKRNFDIHLTGNIDFNLGQFEIFRHYLNYDLLDSYVIKHLGNDSYILFITTQVKNMGRGRLEGYAESQTWALAYLKRDFGRVLIRRETLTDKLLELIHPIELDFDDDKPFSDTFYVLVNDHQKAINAIDRHFRNVVMDIREDDFLIEIVEHTLIIGDQKPISPERAVYLAEFVSRLASLC